MSSDLTLCLGETEVRAPRDHQVTVRIEAAPIGPSDLGTMFAGADLSTATSLAAGSTAVHPPTSRSTSSAASTVPRRCCGAISGDVVGRRELAAKGLLVAYRRRPNRTAPPARRRRDHHDLRERRRVALVVGRGRRPHPCAWVRSAGHGPHSTRHSPRPRAPAGAGAPRGAKPSHKVHWLLWKSPQFGALARSTPSEISESDRADGPNR